MEVRFLYGPEKFYVKVSKWLVDRLFILSFALKNLRIRFTKQVNGYGYGLLGSM